VLRNTTKEFCELCLKKTALGCPTLTSIDFIPLFGKTSEQNFKVAGSGNVIPPVRTCEMICLDDVLLRQHRDQPVRHCEGLAASSPFDPIVRGMTGMIRPASDSVALNTRVIFQLGKLV
jgi:hypothetical protein